MRREANSSEEHNNSDNSNNIPPVIAQSSVEGDVSDSGGDGRRGATGGGTGLFTDPNNVDITDDKMNKTFQQKNYTLANNVGLKNGVRPAGWIKFFFHCFRTRTSTTNQSL